MALDSYSDIMIAYSAPVPRSNLGLYLLSGKTSYRQISWSLEVARFYV